MLWLQYIRESSKWLWSLEVNPRSSSLKMLLLTMLSKERWWQTSCLRERSVRPSVYFNFLLTVSLLHAIMNINHSVQLFCINPTVMIMMMIRQFKRCRNISMKSLQGRRTPDLQIYTLNAEQRQTAADPWTKPTDLSHLPACSQLWNYIHHRHHYYSARKLILILPSHTG